MARQLITIDSILGGQSATQYIGGKGTFNSSIALDPDLPIGSDIKTSGMLVPSRYEKFSGVEITGFPSWIITQPKTTNSFLYASDGKLHSFDSSIAMRTSDEASTSLPITISGGAGNGAVYYNNFIYLMEAMDITQYGGMDQGASITETTNVWTGGKFGLTALTNTTYPSIRGTPIPNHAGHIHGDNAMYFCDVVNGQGVLHKLKTKETTIEGDTNDSSSFNALDLPFGFFPTDIESWGTDIIICAIQTLDTTINQGKAAIFIWNPTDTVSFYRGPIYLPDPLVTAMLNINGVVHIWSGNANNGVRLSRYLGGDVIEEILYLEEGVPPFAGSVDALGNRIAFGGFTTYPVSSASVLSYGSKRADLPKGLNNIVKSTSTGSTQMVFSLKYLQQTSNIAPRLIVGWGDGSAKGLDKLSTSATYASVFRSEMFNVGRKFEIEEIRIPLGAAVASNMSIVPKILFDDLSTTITLDTINDTNFTGSERKIIYKNPDLKTARGENNFLMEFTFGGTVELPITLPIEIIISTFDDEA